MSDQSTPAAPAKPAPAPTTEQLLVVQVTRTADALTRIADCLEKIAKAAVFDAKHS